MATKRTFFMRFYGRTREEIKQCVAEIKLIYPQLPKYIIRESINSVNMFLSAEDQPVYQLTFYFAAQEIYDRLKQDDIKQIYSKWAMKRANANGEIVYQKPGDACFGRTLT